MAKTIRANLVAAEIHRHMCECPKHGYTQGANRWGRGSQGPCALVIDGLEYVVPGNDYDCSSSVKKAWELALQHTPYAGCLGADGYDRHGNWVSWFTGNERQGFLETGLFEWKPMSFIAEPGDLYLNEDSHVAMCQMQVPDTLSEFLSNEFGGITGGQEGDQTGGESVVRPFWTPSFGWDGILHYNGKADVVDNGRRGVHTHTCNQTMAQKWEFIPTGNPDEYRIRSRACGKYLMLNPDITREGGFAVCVGDQTCEWELTQLRVAQPLDKPVNLTCGARYLDAIGGAFGKTGIQAVSTPSTGYSAKWYLVWAGEPSTYYIHACGSDLCLDVDNGGRL